MLTGRRLCQRNAITCGLQTMMPDRSYVRILDTGAGCVANRPPPIEIVPPSEVYATLRESKTSHLSAKSVDRPTMTLAGCFRDMCDCVCHDIGVAVETCYFDVGHLR
jgi:hypothetical protein